MNTLKHRRSLSESHRISICKKLSRSSCSTENLFPDVNSSSSRSTESSPRRCSVTLSPCSTESSPRRCSIASSPRSTESSPRSTESSPRRKINNIIHKFKAVKEPDEPASQHSTIYPLRDEFGRELGKYHYELFEYAMNGNVLKVKEILDNGDYNQLDKSMIIDTATKYDHPDLAYFVSNYS